MKRRDSIKTLLIGAVAGATVTTGTGCKTEGLETEIKAKATNALGLYGRLPKEKARDEQYSWKRNISMSMNWRL